MSEKLSLVTICDALSQCTTRMKVQALQHSRLYVTSLLEFAATTPVDEWKILYMEDNENPVAGSSKVLTPVAGSSKTLPPPKEESGVNKLSTLMVKKITNNIFADITFDVKKKSNLTRALRTNLQKGSSVSEHDIKSTKGFDSAHFAKITAGILVKLYNCQSKKPIAGIARLKTLGSVIIKCYKNLKTIIPLFRKKLHLDDDYRTRSYFPGALSLEASSNDEYTDDERDEDLVNTVLSEDDNDSSDDDVSVSGKSCSQFQKPIPLSLQKLEDSLQQLTTKKNEFDHLSTKYYNLYLEAEESKSQLETQIQKVLEKIAEKERDDRMVEKIITNFEKDPEYSLNLAVELSSVVTVKLEKLGLLHVNPVDIIKVILDNHSDEDILEASQKVSVVKTTVNDSKKSAPNEVVANNRDKDGEENAFMTEQEPENGDGLSSQPNNEFNPKNVDETSQSQDVAVAPVETVDKSDLNGSKSQVSGVQAHTGETDDGIGESANEIVTKALEAYLSMDQPETVTLPQNEIAVESQVKGSTPVLTFDDLMQTQNQSILNASPLPSAALHILGKRKTKDQVRDIKEQSVKPKKKKNEKPINE